jgi:hypothetical protein
MTATHPTPRAGILSWDTNQSPDIEDLAKLIHTLSDGKLHLREIDTKSDFYAVVISDAELDEATTDRLFGQWWCSDDRYDVVKVAHGWKAGQ